LCVVLALTWVFYIWPSGHTYVNAADPAYHFMGGLAWLKWGQLPFLDFFATYGPLNFLYFGSTFLAADGTLLIHHIAFSCFVLMNYKMFFDLLSIQHSATLRILFFVVFMLYTPAPIHFWMQTLPTAFLWFAYKRYVKEIGSPNTFFFGLGILISIAFLLRHDFAIYLLPATLLFLYFEKARMRGLVLLFLGLTPFLGPLLLYLLSLGRMSEVLSHYFYLSTDFPINNSVPHPIFFSREIWNGLIHLTIYLGALLAFYKAISFPKTAGHQLKIFYIGTSLTGLAHLIYSTTYSGINHLTSSSSAALIAIVVLFAFLKSGKTRNFLFTLFFVLMLVPGSKLVYFSYFKGQLSLDKFKDSVIPLDELAQKYASQNTKRFITLFSKCTYSDESVASFPYLLNIPFFSERRPANKHHLIAHGHFRQARFQSETVAAWEVEAPTAILLVGGKEQLDFLEKEYNVLFSQMKKSHVPVEVGEHHSILVVQDKSKRVRDCIDGLKI
jgi:hypothetical protein